MIPRDACAGAPVREEQQIFQCESSPLQPVGWNISNISFPREEPLLQQGKDEEEEEAETVNM